MAAIDQAATVAIPPAVLDALKAALWAWTDEHAEDRVFTVKIWIISKTFRVKDLDPVFELILGPKPATA